MSLTFDQVLPTLVRICETTLPMEPIEQILVIRDLVGCLRLVIKANPPIKKETIEQLEQNLAQDLGGYFKKPILLTIAARSDEKRLAKELLSRPEAKDWSAPHIDPVTQQEKEGSTGKWKKLERRLSKLEWLDQAPLEGGATPPWELDNAKPAIVTFYSFKGGVGRSTALVSCAWQLATAGKRVCIIDLDLEAPGLGSLLEVQTERGILDLLVDHVATNALSLEGCHAAPTQVMGEKLAALVDVIPAGTINLAYLEKLSRLDFVGTQTAEERRSPVQRAMNALLGRIRGELRPDYILLDSRAGLHDMAGLSLHGLAHVDVLVARATEQSYAGLDLTLQALGLRKNSDQLYVAIVHAFAPLDEASTVGTAERALFRSRVYESCKNYIYRGENIPQESDDDQAHSPLVIAQNPSLERFTSLAAESTNAALLSNDFKRLCERIVEMCTPEVEDEES